MKKYVTDTHALLWYLAGSARLGEEARVVFDAAAAGDAEIIVPAIVVAEIVMLAEKRSAIDFQRIMSEVRSMGGFLFVPLLAETASAIQHISALPDIHDRLIVAEAMHQRAALITFDKAITGAGLVEVVW